MNSSGRYRKIILGCGLVTSVSVAQGDSHAFDLRDHESWQSATGVEEGVHIKNGLLSAVDREGVYKSKFVAFGSQKKLGELTATQSPVWLNWEPVKNIGPSNLGDAPVFVSVGPNNYWMFGRYYGEAKKAQDFVAEDATLDGFDIALRTTPFKNQYDAPGGLKEKLGGYHAWQSRDMKNWVHHGAVTEGFSRWVTTAEYVDGDFYIYYDYPNDQDPHLYIDSDLTDGVPGKNHGLAVPDPSDGSDCGVIRDLEGNFHVIFEDWSPIDANKRSWDSPLAGRASSKNGKSDFVFHDPPVDARTTPTGKMAKYNHPHWKKEHPDWDSNVAEYEVHEPEQEAYGDWAAISIGGQYYLFGDYDKSHGETMSVAWFTSSDLSQPFEKCGHVGKGHPDPDVGFAEGRFYLMTQQKNDFVSDGPWVDGVEVRVGVDTSEDGKADTWTQWASIKESYDHIPGFSKQIQRKPASLDLASLPDGYGCQFEVRLKDTTENESTPLLETLQISFAE